MGDTGIPIDRLEIQSLHRLESALEKYLKKKMGMTWFCHANAEFLGELTAGFDYDEGLLDGLLNEKLFAEDYAQAEEEELRQEIQTEIEAEAERISAETEGLLQDNTLDGSHAHPGARWASSLAVAI